MIVLILISGVQAQSVGATKDYQVSPDHKLSVYAQGPLTYQDGGVGNFLVNFTMSDYRVQNSKINILYVQFLPVDAASGQAQSASTNATQESLTVANPSIVYNTTISAPRAVTRFYLNINFTVIPIGGGVNETQTTFTYRFPTDGAIVVQQNNLVPLVNLYGFPSGNFFSFWLPIYAVAVFALLSPAIVVGLVKLREYRSGPQEQVKEEETNE